VEAALRSFYEEQQWPDFTHVIWCPSPRAAFNESGEKYWRGQPAATRRVSDLVKQSKFKGAFTDPWRPILGSRRTTNADFDKAAFTSKQETLFNPLGIILEQVIGFIPSRYTPKVLEFPTEVHWDEENRFHSDDGTAIVWKDGHRHFYIHGVSVSRRFAMEPPTLGYINSQINTEHRRILLERYGYDRYLQEMKAELRHEDNFGKLWVVDRTRARNRLWRSAPSPVRRRMPHVPHYSAREAEKIAFKEFWRTQRGWDEQTENIVLVEMVNSTPEPDGSYRRYFERVDPDIQTAKEAIAWQFRLSAKEYNPKVET
jgi:hypothetical protein